MSGLALVLDGITIQHAGELLHDSPASRPFRHECEPTYRRCLEDYAFACLFGEVILVAGRLPDVLGDRPGDDLRLQNTRIQPIERLSGVAITVTGAMELPAFKELLVPHLGRLLAAYRLESGVWDDFFLRDAQTYLGDNEKLAESGLNAAEYVYAQNVPGVDRVDYYLNDQALQERILEDFVLRAHGSLRPHFPATRVSDDALREFVRRAALTHTAISEWYDEVRGTAMGSDMARIPFATRATLWQAADQTLMRMKELKETVVPHALADAIRNAGNDRHRLSERLVTMWSDPPYPALRDRVCEAVEALRDGDDKGARQLVREIRGIQRSGKEPSVVDRLSIKMGIAFEHSGTSVTPWIEVPAGVGDPLLQRSRRYVLRSWVTQNTEADYEARLRLTFPELYRD